MSTIRFFGAFLLLPVFALGACQSNGPEVICGDNVCVASETCATCDRDCGGCNLAECGDRACNGNETCATCPGDCGDCNLPGCGDGPCNGAETCLNCALDCGSCPEAQVCGDGACGPGESCISCQVDCAPCPSTCGDGACLGETCQSCPQDCGACGGACPDGTCSADENCASCFVDCGACEGSCGDGTCGVSETCSNCPADCGACGLSCGDGSCNEGETCGNCSADCGACGPVCGNGICEEPHEDPIFCSEDCTAACSHTTFGTGTGAAIFDSIGMDCDGPSDCHTGICISAEKTVGETESWCGNKGSCLNPINADYECPTEYMCEQIAHFPFGDLEYKCIRPHITVCPPEGSTDCGNGVCDFGEDEFACAEDCL